ncbi:TetR/AcrR family transcriptional regulator [Rubrimonas cliftonensis]|uniref:TetR/AcrR family transcriptional regulator n=1 Tax=Rubrimonas cliftonensis TaxID=89524 RepID=UPI001114A27C|nr:TetR/AcrR family transcriptional regulator [Rubrimonas cliftonensis]
MARPYSFEPEAALEAAMQVFWRDGYELARLAELQSQMGIQRGSLYNEFGSKKALFLKALNKYVALHVDPGIALLLRSDMSAEDRIDAFFRAIPKNEPRGCLLCNTAASIAGIDAEVRKVVATQLSRFHNAFNAALTNTVQRPDERRKAASRLTQEYIGRRVEARVAA